MSINQKSGREKFRRRFVSGSIFVSPCPPECHFQSETKIEPDLRLKNPSKPRQICDTVRLHGFTRLTCLFHLALPSLQFPNSFIPKVLSLPPFYFTSSAVTMLSHVIRSKNTIEDWLNLPCFRTFTVLYWEKTWVENHFSLFWKRVFDELSSVSVSAVFQF